MYGDGKSDRLIVAEKRPNKDYGAPQSAEGVERSGLTKGNSFNKPSPGHSAGGSIWTTLNGHEVRNRGHRQESAPTSRLPTSVVPNSSGFKCLP